MAKKARFAAFPTTRWALLVSLAALLVVGCGENPEGDKSTWKKDIVSTPGEPGRAVRFVVGEYHYGGGREGTKSVMARAMTDDARDHRLTLIVTGTSADGTTWPLGQTYAVVGNERSPTCALELAIPIVNSPPGQVEATVLFTNSKGGILEKVTRRLEIPAPDADTK